MRINVRTLVVTLSLLIKLVFQKILIHSPKELKELFKDRVIHASYSNFGKIPYGFTITGRIYYDPDDADAEKACSPLKIEDIPKEPEVDKSPIIMVDRGSCNFVEKVKNVENAKGHAALVVDSIKSEDPQNLIMSDDARGTGKNIHIPGILISYKDGQIIKDFYKKNKDNKSILEKIIIEIDFEIEQSKVVDYNFFFSSENFEVYRAIKELYHYHKHIKSSARLIPTYVTNSYLSQENCFSDRKYCAFPRSDLEIDDARTILMENLRQKCIYNEFYNRSQSDNDDYFNYMSDFYDKCIGNKTIPIDFSEKCSNEVMKNNNIDYDLISNCIKESFSSTSDNFDEYVKNDNKLFKNDNERKIKLGVWLVPSLYINNGTFWGNWNGENIFEAICAGYKKKPEVCYDESAPFKNLNTKGLSNGAIIAIIILVLAFNVGIFFLCRRFIKKKINQKIDETDINLKINTVVTSYLALKENK